MFNDIQRYFYAGLDALQHEDLDTAEQAFEQLLLLKKDSPEIWVNRGVIALKRQQGQQAIHFFTMALGYAPDHIEARNNLAATFIYHDRYENALVHYNYLLERFPHEIEYLYNAGVAEMALGHLDKAEQHFLNCLIQNSNHFAALQNLAAIAMRLQKISKAVDFLKRAIQANPQDTVCPFMLSAITNKNNNNRPTEGCVEYVLNLFDHYALYYDSHMQGALKYELPFQLGRILHQHQIFDIDSALDLGCGTGLSGIVLRESAKRLTGVDLSNKMLNKSREKEIYDELFEQDITTFLLQTSQKYSLIVALDVLPYTGDLSAFINAVSHALSSDGKAFFSCEISECQPWYLEQSLRFCHHPDYISHVIQQANMQLFFQEKVPARIQNGEVLFEIIYGVALA